MGYAGDYAFVEEDSFLLWQSGKCNFSLVSKMHPKNDRYNHSSLRRRYVKTNILSDEAFEHVSSVGVQFAEADDAGQCLLRILGDASINGHSIFISGRKWASKGYMDLDLDDYLGNSLVNEIQDDQMKSAPVSLGLFV